MADPAVTALREAALHRGFRLLASRKRTPGTGDYGKFGLLNVEGKPLLGVCDEGLTATVAILAEQGCESIEVMSDIDIRSAKGFFRRSALKIPATVSRDRS